MFKVPVRKVPARLADFPNVTGTVPLRAPRARQFKIVVAGDWRLIFEPHDGEVVVVETKRRAEPSRGTSLTSERLGLTQRAAPASDSLRMW